MKTGIFLSYRGLGANMLHLSYCHEIAKKYGPVNLVTLCPNLREALKYDPSFEQIIYLGDHHKKFFDILKLSKFFKSLKFENFFIFYPSFRYFLSSKIAGIPNIYQYPLFKKKRLHLVNAAKQFTERSLKINNCPTETKIFINKDQLNYYNKNNLKKIIVGIGSSGPTTRWGYRNYSNLIKKLKSYKKFYFYLLCGSDENDGAEQIIKDVGSDICESLSKKNIDEIINYVAISDLYIGNDSFGHHLACQMDKPCFIILLNSPKAYSDYSKNQYRIIPPHKNIDEIDHGSKLDPNTISVDMVIDKIKKFI